MKHSVAGRLQLTAEKSVLMTVWYLANMECFRQISDRFGVTLSCAHNSIKSVLQHIVSISKIYIKWPTQAEARQSAILFEKKQGLKNVIRAIDGSHIQIRKPKNFGNDYINRKGYPSILLQGTVNVHMLFIDVMLGEPGSIHDARMLRKSSLYMVANENYNQLFYGKFCLLGDSAYPSLRWLVPPYKDDGHLSNEQIQFNYRHSSTRIVIENAFGLLKGRFRRLKAFENLHISFIINCVMAACMLHNLCILKNDLTEEICIEMFSDQSNIEEEGHVTTREAMYNALFMN